MTEKHFDAIAEALRERMESAEITCNEGAKRELRILIGDFADRFLAFNSGFDKQRFKNAAGFYV